MKTVLFINFSNQPFSAVPYEWPDPKSGEPVLTTDDHCMWDKVPDSFAPGASRYMEDWRAEHYAKHLINRELDKANKPTSDLRLRADMLKECIKLQSEEIAPSRVDMELMNKNAPEPVEIAKKVPEVAKKTSKKLKTETKVEEPEFPDLKA